MNTNQPSDDPEIATAQVSARLTSMSDTDQERLSGTLRHLIDHIVGRIEYAENRRQSFATTAAGFIAAGIALLSIVMRAQGSPVRACLTAVAIGLLLTGSVVIFAWAQQTNPRYGFIGKTKLSRPWKWFYRDALDNSNAFDLQWWKKATDPVNSKSVDAFNEQWATFSLRQLSLSDRKEDIVQDLKQVYLLHVNERLKNLFLSQLKSILKWGLICSIGLALFVLAVAFMRQPDPKPRTRNEVPVESPSTTRIPSVVPSPGPKHSPKKK